MRKRLRETTFAVACLVGAVTLGLEARQESSRRATLAIVEFDAAPGGWTLPPRELGSTLSQLMLDRLVSSGEYHVIDAGWLARGIRNRDAVVAAIREAAVEHSIDYVVFGSVVQFSNESRQRAGGIVLPLAAVVATHGLALPLIGAFRHNRSELVLAVTVRVVDVRTGEVVTTATGQGVASRKKLGAGGIGGVGGAGYGTAAADYRDAVVAEAAAQAVTNAARQLLTAAPRLAASRDERARRP
jgi:curli biogenesis system outer membrane secretion channel CsgG